MKTSLLGYRSRCFLASAMALTVQLLAFSACAQGKTNPESPINHPTSFEECVAQHGKVLKSFPARCVTDDGLTFIDQRAELGGGKACKDLCGDGRCQEIVCMAVGCPCAETAKSCPQDCH